MPIPIRFVVLIAATVAVCRGADAQVRVDQVHAFANRTYHSPLIQATDGNFYGTVRDRYAAVFGAVYGLTADGPFTVLHDFVGASDGARPSLRSDTRFGWFALWNDARGRISELLNRLQDDVDGSLNVLYAFSGADR